MSEESNMWWGSDALDRDRWAALVEPTLERLQRANVQIAEGKKQGGLGGKLKEWAGAAKAATCFASLYFIPVKKHKVPAVTRLVPSY